MVTSLAFLIGNIVNNTEVPVADSTPTSSGVNRPSGWSSADEQKVEQIAGEILTRGSDAMSVYEYINQLRNEGVITSNQYKVLKEELGLYTDERGVLHVRN